MVDKDGKQENIVRHWESHLRPRILHPIDYANGKYDILDVFGYQGNFLWFFYYNLKLLYNFDHEYAIF